MSLRCRRADVFDLRCDGCDYLVVSTLCAQEAIRHAWEDGARISSGRWYCAECVARREKERATPAEVTQ